MQHLSINKYYLQPGTNKNLNEQKIPDAFKYIFQPFALDEHGKKYKGKAFSNFSFSEHFQETDKSSKIFLQGQLQSQFQILAYFRQYNKTMQQLNNVSRETNINVIYERKLLVHQKESVEKQSIKIYIQLEKFHYH